MFDCSLTESWYPCRLFLSLDPIYVIVEYLNKGDLKNVLIGCRSEDTGTGYFNIHGISKSLSKTLIKFARDVASGMAFLSSQKVSSFCIINFYNYCDRTLYYYK